MQFQGLAVTRVRTPPSPPPKKEGKKEKKKTLRRTMQIGGVQRNVSVSDNALC